MRWLTSVPKCGRTTLFQLSNAEICDMHFLHVGLLKDFQNGQSLEGVKK